jgi:hypothetical protein
MSDDECGAPPCTRSLEYQKSNRGLLLRNPIDSARVERHDATEETEMRTTASLAMLCGIAGLLVCDPHPSHAFAPASQLYPYCQINSSNGGMNCYLSSRDQCEFREVCIQNPSYLGAQAARAWKRKNKPQWRWW